MFILIKYQLIYFIKDHENYKNSQITIKIIIFSNNKYLKSKKVVKYLKVIFDNVLT